MSDFLETLSKIEEPYKRYLKEFGYYETTVARVALKLKPMSGKGSDRIFLISLVLPSKFPLPVVIVQADNTCCYCGGLLNKTVDEAECMLCGRKVSGIFEMCGNGHYVCNDCYHSKILDAIAGLIVETVIANYDTLWYNTEKLMEMHIKIAEKMGRKLNKVDEERLFSLAFRKAVVQALNELIGEHPNLEGEAVPLTFPVPADLVMQLKEGCYNCRNCEEYEKYVEEIERFLKNREEERKRHEIKCSSCGEVWSVEKGDPLDFVREHVKKHDLPEPKYEDFVTVTDYLTAYKAFVVKYFETQE